MTQDTRPTPFREANAWPTCEACGLPADHHYLGGSPGLLYCAKPRSGRTTARSTNLDAETWAQLRVLCGYTLTRAQSDAALAARIARGTEPGAPELFGGLT